MSKTELEIGCQVVVGNLTNSHRNWSKWVIEVLSGKTGTITAIGKAQILYGKYRYLSYTVEFNDGSGWHFTSAELRRLI